MGLRRYSAFFSDFMARNISCRRVYASLCFVASVSARHSRFPYFGAACLRRTRRRPPACSTFEAPPTGRELYYRRTTDIYPPALSARVLVKQGCSRACCIHSGCPIRSLISGVECIFVPSGAAYLLRKSATGIARSGNIYTTCTDRCNCMRLSSRRIRLSR